MNRKPERAGAGVTRRLDHAVADAAGVSRQHARRLLVAGQVRVNGRIALAADKGRPINPAVDRVRLADGFDDLSIETEAALQVLAEGPGWVAVDKPAGAAVHPLRPDERGTLLQAVAARYPQVQGVGDEGPLRAGVVHRLDTDTSGVILFALDDAHWRRFRDAFSGHRVEKRYLAVVHGSPPDTGRIDLHLAVLRHRPARVGVVPRDHPGGGARRCTLDFTVIERLRGAAMVGVDLHTGFLHQIRVSLAHLGHPLLGDGRYGDPSTDPVKCERTMLHAASLFIEEVHAEAALPADFAGALSRLRAGDRGTTLA